MFTRHIIRAHWDAMIRCYASRHGHGMVVFLSFVREMRGLGEHEVLREEDGAVSAHERHLNGGEFGLFGIEGEVFRRGAEGRCGTSQAGVREDMIKGVGGRESEGVLKTLSWEEWDDTSVWTNLALLGSVRWAETD
jgi:hypothetical protein